MITSTGNQQMKEIVQLQKKSKARCQQRVFVVEGPKMVFEVPKEHLVKLYVSESFLRDPSEFRKLEALGCSYETVSNSVLKSVSDTKTPQGILALVRMPSYTLEDLYKIPLSCGQKKTCNVGESSRTQLCPSSFQAPHLLILESIQDPGNLGTILRTGEGAGISGVLMNRTTVDLFHPKVIRSTMGSIFRVPFYIADDLEEAVRRLKSNSVKIYAAHLEGRLSYDQPDYTEGCAFLIGNEGNGLTPELASLADAYIRIPMEGNVESLNAAIAAALLMYEANRQRR